MPDVGDDVTITTRVLVDGVLADPGSISIVVTKPSGGTVTPTPSTTGTGLYEAVVTVDEPKRWQYKWTTTSPNGEEFGYFDVAADPPARLQPLATTQDLADALGRALTDAELARAPALLRGASAKIRGYTKQQFDLVGDDTIILRPVGSHLRLPQRPVIAVTSVTAVGGAGLPDITLPGASWQWDGIDLVELFPLDPNVWLSLPSFLADDRYDGPDTYKVVYDHGYATTPDDVLAVCCTMVLRTLTAPTTTEGLVQERIGQYAYQYGQGPGQQSPGVTVRMTDQDRQDLKHYRRTASSIALRVR